MIGKNTAADYGLQRYFCGAPLTLYMNDDNDAVPGGQTTVILIRMFSLPKDYFIHPRLNWGDFMSIRRQ